MPATLIGMSPTAEQNQLAAVTEQTAAFISENERILNSLRLLLENPGRNPNHTYAEVLRLITRVRDTADLTAATMALVTRREPAALSLRTLADALGISVNTLRRRIQALSCNVPEAAFPSGGVRDD